MKRREILKLSRLFAILIVLIFSFLRAGCQKVDYNAVKVKEALDGDTIILSNNQSVRYIGIDTPELRKKIGDKWVYEPMPFAEEAKALNEKLVKGKLARLEFDVEKKDKYHRLLAYCFIGDNLINAKLVEDGLALLYTRVPNIKYVDLLVKSQRKARDSKKGIWQEVKIVPAEEAGFFLGRVETVEGRVKSTSVTEKAIYLNFGNDYRKDFTAVIFKDDLGVFNRDELISSNFYKGRRLRITGQVREYNGPEIIVNHPWQIEDMN